MKKTRISPHNTISGYAFPDFVRSEKKVLRRYFDSCDFEDEKNPMRTFFLPIFLGICVLALFVKLFFLQIVNGSYYRDLADNNRIRTYPIRAPRGIIFDRSNEPLVYNVPGYRVTVDGKTKLLDRDEALTSIATGRKNLEIDTLRQYRHKEGFAHVLGYIGEISQEELKMPLYKEYKAGDLIGKMGIEQMYENKLKGIDGKELVEMDASGKIIRSLGETDPVSGEDITLTLDSRLQNASFDALKDAKKGVVIVSTPKGEILALVSKPSFDPNLFTLGDIYSSEMGEYKQLEEVLSDTENQPLLNRAISGLYPPGSTFKLITAASGLENKIIDETYAVNDKGIMSIGSFTFSNWYFTQYGKTEGDVDIVKAIKRSNDTFFYQLAGKIGVDKLSESAKKFGVGEKTGIDLIGEQEGILPTSLWKKETIGEQWYLGDTYHYGIGQGYLLVSPLQVNVWTQAIANGGEWYEPHLLKNQKSTLRLRSGREIKNQNLLSRKSFELIRQGMIESCSSGGVAWPLFEFKIQNAKLKVDGKNFFGVPQSTSSAKFKDHRQVTIACKTGTAQHGGEKTLPHAWITLFAPAYDPQIIVTVLVEESGEGSNIAAPIAKKVLEEWFLR